MLLMACDELEFAGHVLSDVSMMCVMTSKGQLCILRHAKSHLLHIVQSVFNPIPEHPIPIQAVGVHSQIQVVDQLCGR